MLSGAGSAAFAQAPAGPAASDAGSVDEVVVTARRREESLQEVPLAVTAVGETQLNERTIRDTNDLSAVVPGIRFGTGGTTSNPAIEARGQSRLPLGDLSGAVVVYFAEVPMPNEGVFVPTYDLSSVQALKGPQGTLFGRNALSGAVLLAPNEPNYQFEGGVTAGIGNLDYRGVEGYLNVPLVEDKAALRLAAEWRRRSGYVDRVRTGTTGHDVDRMSLRASLLLEPTNTFQNLTILDYFEANEEGGTPILYKLAPGLASGPALTALYAQQQALGMYAVNSTGPQHEERTLFGITNRTTWDVTETLTLKNIFGYRTSESDSAVDTDGTPAVFNHVAAVSHGKQTTEEFQVLGKSFGERLNWIVGTFWYWQEPDGLYGNRSDVFLIQPWRQAYQERESRAVYAQGDYNLSDWVKGLSFTAGVRRTEDELTVCSLAAPGANVPPIPEDSCATYPGVPPLIPPASTVKTDYAATTYTFAVNYQATDDLLFYLTHRKGFREGGVNTPAFVTPGVTTNPPCPNGRTLCRDLRPVQTFGPQTAIDYEAGMKSDWRWDDVFLRLNVSIYETHYEDLQSLTVLAGVIDITDPGAPPFGAVTFNGGEVRVRGVEAEAVLRPLDGLELYANLNYNSGKQIEAGQIPIAGAPVTNALVRDVFNYGAGARYSMPVGGGDSRLTFNIDWYHNDENDAAHDPAQFVPAYDLVNMRATWSKVGGTAVDLSLFGKNVFDEKYITGLSSAAPAFGFTSALVGEPQTYGLEASWRFGD